MFTKTISTKLNVRMADCFATYAIAGLRMGGAE